MRRVIVFVGCAGNRSAGNLSRWADLLPRKEVMDINVYCYKCNSSLEVVEEYNEGYPFHGITVKVEPCPECAAQQSAPRTVKKRRAKKDIFDPRDVSILGGDPSL